MVCKLLLQGVCGRPTTIIYTYFKELAFFAFVTHRTKAGTAPYSFALSFALTRPLCLVLLAPPQARHKSWTGQARWLKLNANTSELGGEGQPEPEAVAAVDRADVVAAG